MKKEWRHLKNLCNEGKEAWEYETDKYLARVKYEDSQWYYLVIIDGGDAVGRGYTDTKEKAQQRCVDIIEDPNTTVLGGESFFGDGYLRMEGKCDNIVIMKNLIKNIDPFLTILFGSLSFMFFMLAMAAQFRSGWPFIIGFGAATWLLGYITYKRMNNE